MLEFEHQNWGRIGFSYIFDDSTYWLFQSCWNLFHLHFLSKRLSPYIEPREMHVFIEREKLHIGIGKHVLPNKFEINPDSSSSKSLLPIDNIYPLDSQVEDSPN